MAGIYIHIPFCRKACYYCNFHFSTSLKHTDDFFIALLQEMAMQKDYLNGQDIDTVYFGGGTPSLSTAEQLGGILTGLNSTFAIKPGAEITLEANPDDISLPVLQEWKKLGINRLSIGVQSFRNEDLSWMNRVHGVNEAVQAIALAQETGFQNITLDLIYGVPGMDDAAWKKNIQTATGLKVPHLSCYALTVEPGTALHKMILLKKKEPADAELAARHFDILVQETAAAGFEQYEISNFARLGFRSRHNTSYWNGIHYLGLGPSAHSFNGTVRQWNVANNIQYIRSLNEGIVPFEQEILTPEQMLNEYVMTALRTIEGADLGFIEKTFGKEHSERIKKESGKYIAAGKMELSGNILLLTPAGRFFADGIAADLFVI